VQLIVALFLAIGVIYIGISLFDRMTKDLDEWEEIKKGNTAVGIVLTAIIISLATVTQSGIAGLTGAIMNVSVSEKYVMAIVGGFVQLIIGIIMAIIAIWLAMYVLDRITKEIDEFAELKKGNVAVAVIMAGVLISVGFIIQAGVAGLSKAIGV
jgi:uncharacterized membrane protein YjfL (UPF0719 family)